MGAEREVGISTESIALAALLKWAQLAATGGDAKRLIQEGRVRVNGEVERRRGRQIVSGDRVEIHGHVIVVTKP